MDEHKTKTILIVEDEAAFRQIYRDAMQSDGFDVLEAETGEEALQLIADSRPDLVLLDIVLPKLNGFDVLTHLRQDPLTVDLPVVVFSVLNDHASIRRAVDLGANDFAIKGTTPAVEVLRKVRDILDGTSNRS